MMSSAHVYYDLKQMTLTAVGSKWCKITINNAETDGARHMCSRLVEGVRKMKPKLLYKMLKNNM